MTRLCKAALLVSCLATEFNRLHAATVSAGGQTSRAVRHVGAGDRPKTRTAARHDRAVSIFPRDVVLRDQLAWSWAGGVKIRAATAPVAGETLRDVRLMVERAAHFAAAGNDVKAAVEYQRAFEREPNTELALHGYARHVGRLGAASMAIQQHLDRLASSKHDLAARLLLAELLRSEARFSEALDQYQMAQRQAPGNLVALRGSAESWLALGYYEQAAERFSQSAPHISAGLALADQARIFIAMGRPAAALNSLLAHPAEVEQAPRALIVLADAYRALARRAEERAVLEKLLSMHEAEAIPALTRIARVYYEIGHQEATQSACNKLLLLDPHDAIAATGLSLLKLPAAPIKLPGSSKKPMGASKKRSGALPPESGAEELSEARRAGLEQEAGEAAIFWREPERATQHLARALSMRPDSFRLQLAQATAFLLARDVEMAASAFASVATVAGRHPEALLGWAQTEMLRRRYQRALEIYRNVLSFDRNNFRALNGESEALRLVGDVERAAVRLVELAQRAPESQPIQTALRETLFALGRAARPGTSNSLELLLDTGDEVRIRIDGPRPINAEVMLDEQGAIHLPTFPAAIQARCLTARELSAAIIEQNRTPLADATVVVNVTAYRRAPLFVAGAVYLPGSFRVRQAFDLRETLMLASGATERAGPSLYVLRHRADACGAEASQQSPPPPVEMYERRAAEEGLVSLARPLQAGDAVIVPERNLAFITGAIARPASVDVARQPLTLLTAVEEVGGGTTPEAQRDRVRLRRLRPGGASRLEFVIDLDAIVQQRVGDVVLSPGDVVEIPSSGTPDPGRSFRALLQRLAHGAPVTTGNTGAPALSSQEKP